MFAVLATDAALVPIAFVATSTYWHVAADPNGHGTTVESTVHGAVVSLIEAGLIATGAEKPDPVLSSYEYSVSVAGERLAAPPVLFDGRHESVT